MQFMSTRTTDEENSFEDDNLNDNTRRKFIKIDNSFVSNLPTLYRTIQPLSAAREIAHGQIQWYNTMFGHLRRGSRRPMNKQEEDDEESQSNTSFDTL